MAESGGTVRVLLHFDKTALFSDMVRERFPDAELRCCNTYAELPAVLNEFAPTVLFSIKFENGPYPRDAVLQCPSLRWLSNGGVGVDHLVPWDPGKLTVTNAAGVASDVMAAYVLGGILTLAMGFPRFLSDKAERRWRFRYVENIVGRTLVVVGLGHTGRAVARLADGMGIRVVGTRARPRATEHVARVFSSDELHEALALGDYVVVSVPLLEGTRHLIDACAMEAMKPGARLVDVSRGGVVDEEALVKALRSKRLGGAVLDVFEREPLPPSSPLWEMDDVILTPHCSSVYEGWERRAAGMFCDNLERWIAGEPLENVVDPVRGY